MTIFRTVCGTVQAGTMLLSFLHLSYLLRLLVCWERDAAACVDVGCLMQGHLQFFMKEHDEAMKTYEAGLSYDKDNSELKEGLMRCQQAINKVCTPWTCLFIALCCLLNCTRCIHCIFKAYKRILGCLHLVGSAALEALMLQNPQLLLMLCMPDGFKQSCHNSYRGKVVCFGISCNSSRRRVR